MRFATAFCTTASCSASRKASRYLRRHPEKLYDVLADPDGLTNLPEKPEQRAVLERMRAEVNAFRKRTKDRWFINDNYK